jgi:hypothetical protein
MNFVPRQVPGPALVRDRGKALPGIEGIEGIEADRHP